MIFSILLSLYCKYKLRCVTIECVDLEIINYGNYAIKEVEEVFNMAKFCEVCGLYVEEIRT